METTFEQQVVMDEALVPSAQRNILHICPRVQGQTFADLPFEEEILDFIAIINKCLTGKTSGYDSLWLSQAQILWGLYYKRNVDYAFLIWEDFVFQVEHKNQKKSNEMYYPRFTKVIIHHFMSKNPSIPRRNKVNWHYARDDFMFSMIKLAYKEYYAIATGKAAPKPKASARRTRSGSDTSITALTAAVILRPIAATTLRLTAAVKGKQTAKASKAKSQSALFEV
nr:hypothetical protein [Tanacetum cinerariifolium]